MNYLEIERKWLITLEAYNKLTEKPVKVNFLHQFYVNPMNTGNTVIRYRSDITYSYDNDYKLTNVSVPKYYQTIKTGSGLLREEFEVEISESFWKEALNFIPSPRQEVIKTRIVTEEGYEVDKYFNRLEGLHTVEKEFASIEDASKFTAPSLFGEEVTDKMYYGNAHLATLSDGTFKKGIS